MPLVFVKIDPDGRPNGAQDSKAPRKAQQSRGAVAGLAKRHHPQLESELKQKQLEHYRVSSQAYLLRQNKYTRQSLVGAKMQWNAILL